MQDNGAKQAEVRTEFPPVIGAALPRVDGPVKTTGRARYAADYNFPGLVYAVPVCATIGHGKIRSMDTSAAEKMPGVLIVLHHGNIGPLFHTAHGGINEERQPFEDEVVYYWGQYVALAVAKTLQQAQAAAAAVRVTYDADEVNVSTKLEDADVQRQTRSKRGDVGTGFANAPVKLDETYATPAEVHNPMELHATTAVWGRQSCDAVRSRRRVDDAPEHVVAGAQRCAEGECAGDLFEVYWVGIRRQAGSVAALGDGGGGGAQAEPAGEADGDAQDDVLGCGAQATDTCRQIRLGPRRMESWCRWNSTTGTTRRWCRTITRTAERRRRLSTARRIWR